MDNNHGDSGALDAAWTQVRFLSQLSATLTQSGYFRVARHPPKDDYEAAEDSNVVRANGQI